MMKRLIAMLECAVLAGMLVCVSPLGQQPAEAQWQVPSDTIPRGRGAGTGFATSGWSINSSNTLTGAPTAGSLSPGIVINQTGNNTSSTAGSSDLCTGLGQPGFSYNKICVLADSANVTSGSPPYTYGMSVGLGTGGTNSTGTKVAFQAQLNHYFASDQSTIGDHIASAGWAVADTSAGGTNTGAGAKGALYASSFVAQLNSGATNWDTVSGGEVDVAINSGATAKNRVGWSVVGTGGVYPSTYDAALAVGASGLAWTNGLWFTSRHGTAPIRTTGTLIGTDGTAVTAAIGIDFSAYTLSSYFLKGPGSTFTVDGSANIVGRSAALNAANGVGLSINNGTVTGTLFPSTDFTNSFQISTAGNHVLAFRTNATLAGYFDTSQQFNLGVAGVSQGVLNINGLTSGTVGVKVQAAAGTYNFNLPTSAGSSGECLKSAGGGSSPMTFASCTSSITPAALTKTDDTNVTLTLGGTPTTALLQATSITVGWTGTLAAARLNANVVQAVTNDTNVTGSISAQTLTLGWTGTLAVSRGGMGAGTFTSNGVLYGNGTGAIQATSQGPANSVLTANAGSPSFSATPNLNSFTIKAAGSAPQFECFSGTCAGFWLSDNGTPTGQQLFFGADASVSASFRVYSALAAANLLQVTGNATASNSTTQIQGFLNSTNVITAQSTTDASSSTVGSLVTSGGLAVAKSAWVGTYLSVGTKVRAGGSAPALSSCGTSPAITGSDLAGEVTMGTGSPTGCVITFNAAYSSAPYCTVTWQATPLASQSYVVSASAITLTQTATSSNKVNYTCMARSAGWLLKRDLDPAANDNTPAFMENVA